MQILPINYSIYSQNLYLGKQKATDINFCHHPDFIALEKSYDVIASNYFRRGGYYDCVSKDFIDVIKSLRLFFNKTVNSEAEKRNMLIGGIAESQEPFSILASVKSLIGKKNINDALDLYIIDLQSKPDDKKLFLQSFYDTNGVPDFVPESFERENQTIYGYKYWHRYRVKDEIYEYLRSVYNNPQKAKWEMRIQDEMNKYPDNSFDVISMNNTIIYIMDYNKRMQILQNIYDKLKPNGIFITDPYMTEFQEVFSSDVCNEIYKGIYRKK